MNVTFSPDGTVSLTDAANLRAFKAVLAGSKGLGDLVRRHPGLVRAVQDDDHLWLDVEAVAGLGPKDSEWRQGFDRMIAYAATKGWTRGEPVEVAAHVEFA